MSLKGKIRTEKPLRQRTSPLYPKTMTEIRYIIIAPLMEKRVIFQRNLSREILLSSLGRSGHLLKAKEHMKGQEEKKESVLGAIKKY